MNLDSMMEEYLLTLEHDENRHYDSEEYSEREDASAELERFVHWLHHEKKTLILYRLAPKPVKQKKQGWMVVWDGNNQYCKTSVLEDRAEASKLLGAMGGYPNVRLVEVTWEV
jgi:hypothetical protein